MVHRDLKPTNIMVTAEGVVKLLDFGIAKHSADSDETQTIEGTVVGTAAYMSPEQAQGKRIDARSDIFSFGSVLYELLSGRRAFSGENAVSSMASILHTKPAPLDAPSALQQIMQRCLARAPADRFQTMADVAQALASDFAAEELGGLLDRATAARPVPRSHDPKRYLHLLREKTGYIDIRGLKVAGGAVRRLAIKELYTPLTTVMVPPDAHDREKLQAPRHVPLQLALNRPRLVLVGFPGGGKSTFLRRIAFAACETLLGDDPSAAGEMFPGGRQ